MRLAGPCGPPQFFGIAIRKVIQTASRAMTPRAIRSGLESTNVRNLNDHSDSSDARVRII